MPVVDLRSDTVTRPSPGMRAVMAAAEVGDDVLGDDPTVRKLEQAAAARLGKEAALFLPSGTMSNQVAIRSHTEPGDEIIAESGAHLHQYESGAPAALSGVTVRGVPGERGILSVAAVQEAILPPSAHRPRSRLLCLENTSNRGGGTLYSVNRQQELCELARSHGLRTHLDGARLFNAAAALDAEPAALAAPFDSVSFCLSKGLGCPVGSLLSGSREFIARAHRFRKMFGGGMRQAGILAAAGLFALERNVKRLADDHRRARRLAEVLARLPGLSIDLEAVQTNIVYIGVAGSGREAALWAERLQTRGIRVSVADRRTLRAVTHLDVDDGGIQLATLAFNSVVTEFRA